MKIDDHIIQAYLSGKDAESYQDCWIFHCFGRPIFENPDEKHQEQVAKLHKKLCKQILTYQPRNYALVKKVFPDFDKVKEDFTILLVVGFPDPYDAMVLENDNREYIVFDLIQFGQESLKEEYSCHGVLTHEILHMCIHKENPRPSFLQYKDILRYKAFDEGFAHALTYPEDITVFIFNDFYLKKYDNAMQKMQHALRETNIKKQQAYLTSADTGDYWDKFASIYGKLYILKNLHRAQEIYKNGWQAFAPEIFI